MASDTRVDSILFGCALAVWRNPVLDELRLNQVRWKTIYMPVVVLVLLGCLYFRAIGFRETFRYSLQGIALTALFVAAIRYYRWAPFAWLNTRPMVFLGSLSYSLYLLHFAALFAVERALPSTNLVLQGAAGTRGCPWRWPGQST